MRRTRSSGDIFEVASIATQETLQSEPWKDRLGAGINEGDCPKFALDLLRKVESQVGETDRVYIQAAPSHVFLAVENENGRVNFFDAETPFGAEYPDDFPYYWRYQFSEERWLRQGWIETRDGHVFLPELRRDNQESGFDPDRITRMIQSLQHHVNGLSRPKR